MCDGINRPHVAVSKSEVYSVFTLERVSDTDDFFLKITLEHFLPKTKSNLLQEDNNEF
jgi:hypothetical protein